MLKDCITFLAGGFKAVGNVLFGLSLTPLGFSQVSYGSLILGFGLIALVLSVFWKGAKK